MIPIEKVFDINKLNIAILGNVNEKKYDEYFSF